MKFIFNINNYLGRFKSSVEPEKTSTSSVQSDSSIKSMSSPVVKSEIKSDGGNTTNIWSRGANLKRKLTQSNRVGAAQKTSVLNSDASRNKSEKQEKYREILSEKMEKLQKTKNEMDLKFISGIHNVAIDIDNVLFKTSATVLEKTSYVHFLNLTVLDQFCKNLDQECNFCSKNNKDKFENFKRVFESDFNNHVRPFLFDLPYEIDGNSKEEAVESLQTSTSNSRRINISIDTTATVEKEASKTQPITDLKLNLDGEAVQIHIEKYSKDYRTHNTCNLDKRDEALKLLNDNIEVLINNAYCFLKDEFNLPITEKQVVELVYMCISRLFIEKCTAGAPIVTNKEKIYQDASIRYLKDIGEQIEKTQEVSSACEDWMDRLIRTQTSKFEYKKAKNLYLYSQDKFLSDIKKQKVVLDDFIEKLDTMFALDANMIQNIQNSVKRSLESRLTPTLNLYVNNRYTKYQVTSEDYATINSLIIELIHKKYESPRNEFEDNKFNTIEAIVKILGKNNSCINQLTVEQFVKERLYPKNKKNLCSQFDFFLEDLLSQSMLAKEVDFICKTHTNIVKIYNDIMSLDNKGENRSILREIQKIDKQIKQIEQLNIRLNNLVDRIFPLVYNTGFLLTSDQIVNAIRRKIKEKTVAYVQLKAITDETKRFDFTNKDMLLLYRKAQIFYLNRQLKSAYRENYPLVLHAADLYKANASALKWLKEYMSLVEAIVEKRIKINQHSIHVSNERNRFLLQTEEMIENQPSDYKTLSNNMNLIKKMRLHLAALDAKTRKLDAELEELIKSRRSIEEEIEKVATIDIRHFVYSRNATADEILRAYAQSLHRNIDKLPVSETANSSININRPNESQIIFDMVHVYYLNQHDTDVKNRINACFDKEENVILERKNSSSSTNTTSTLSVPTETGMWI